MTEGLAQGSLTLASWRLALAAGFSLSRHRPSKTETKWERPARTAQYEAALRREERLRGEGRLGA